MERGFAIGFHAGLSIQDTGQSQRPLTPQEFLTVAGRGILDVLDIVNNIKKRQDGCIADNNGGLNDL